MPKRAGRARAAKRKLRIPKWNLRKITVPRVNWRQYLKLPLSDPRQRAWKYIFFFGTGCMPPPTARHVVVETARRESRIPQWNLCKINIPDVDWRPYFNLPPSDPRQRAWKYIFLFGTGCMSPTTAGQEVKTKGDIKIYQQLEEEVNKEN